MSDRTPYTPASRAALALPAPCSGPQLRSVGERRKRRLLAAAAGLVGVGALGWALAPSARAPALAPTQPVNSAPLELLPDDVAVAELRSLRRSVLLTGTLQPLDRTEVKAQQAGEIAEVRVRAGDRVRRGQLLARLDRREFQARLSEKLANLAAGNAQLELARKKRENTRALFERELLSRAEFDARESEYQVSAAQVDSLQAQVEQARKALEDTAITSPLDGVVAERATQRGTAVTPGTRLFSVLDLSIMELAALVPASDIPAVQIGSEASFRIEGFGERALTGTVERINPATEPGTRSIAVYLRIPNPRRELRGGMFAQGTLAARQSESATVIPTSALREDAGVPIVYRIENGALVRQPVEVGARDSAAGLVKITAGLAPGDAVVSTALENLRPGMSVRVQALASSPPAAAPAR